MKCPRCQQDNPAYARFCLGCGARLALACTNLPAGAEILASLEARYPTHEEEQVETKGWAASGYPPPRGIWVALATFIPTFLAVFTGVPVLLGSAPARHAAEPRATTMTVTASPAPTVRTHGHRADAAEAGAGQGHLLGPSSRLRGQPGGGPAR